jgi:hypothetical protein
VLVDYYVYRESIELSFFFVTQYLRTCLRRTGGHGWGIDLGIGCFGSFRAWLAAAVSSILSLEGSRRDAM